MKIQTHAHYNTAGKKLCADRKITKVKQGAKEPSFLSRRSRKWGVWLTQTFDILSSTKRFHEGVKEVLGVIQGLLIFMHDLWKYKIKTQLTVKFFLFTVCEPSSFVPFCDVLILLFETPSPLLFTTLFYVVNIVVKLLNWRWCNVLFYLYMLLSPNVWLWIRQEQFYILFVNLSHQFKIMSLNN